MNRTLNRLCPPLILGIAVLIISTTLACEESDADVSPDARDTSCERLCEEDFWRNTLVAAEVRAELNQGARNLAGNLV